MSASPHIGDRVVVRGIECRIIAVHRFGTVDVQEIGGDRCWRVSGLGTATDAR